MATYTRAELVEAVKKFAREHYEQDGWDLVIETMDDKEIDDAIGTARSPTGAIANVGSEIGLYNEKRQSVIAEIF